MPTPGVHSIYIFKTQCICPPLHPQRLILIFLASDSLILLIYAKASKELTTVSSCMFFLLLICCTNGLNPYKVHQNSRAWVRPKVQQVMYPIFNRRQEQMLIISCYQFTLICQAAQITAEASDSSSILEWAALATTPTLALGSSCGREKVICLAAAMY